MTKPQEVGHELVAHSSSLPHWRGTADPLAAICSFTTDASRLKSMVDRSLRPSNHLLIESIPLASLSL